MNEGSRGTVGRVSCVGGKSKRMSQRSVEVTVTETGRQRSQEWRDR